MRIGATAPDELKVRLRQHFEISFGVTHSTDWKDLWVSIILEARVGIEPTHKGFADLSLTTWVPRLTQARAGRIERDCLPDSPPLVAMEWSAVQR